MQSLLQKKYRTILKPWIFSYLLILVFRHIFWEFVASFLKIFQIHRFFFQDNLQVSLFNVIKSGTNISASVKSPSMGVNSTGNTYKYCSLLKKEGGKATPTSYLSIYPIYNRVDYIFIHLNNYYTHYNHRVICRTSVD